MFLSNDGNNLINDGNTSFCNAIWRCKSNSSISTIPLISDKFILFCISALSEYWIIVVKIPNKVLCPADKLSRLGIKIVFVKTLPSYPTLKRTLAMYYKYV